MTSVTLVSSLVLLCWKLCGATAASHRLAYWWVQAHNTKVGWLLCFFRWERRSSDNTWDHPIFNNFVDETFQWLLWLSEEMEELAIQDSLCTDSQLQFTIKNITCKGLTIARKCLIIHGDRKLISYSIVWIRWHCNDTDKEIKVQRSLDYPNLQLSELYELFRGHILY